MVVNNHKRFEVNSEIDQKIGEKLKEAPVIKGYTARQLSDTLAIPWTTVKWHLERMESVGLVSHVEVGRAKVYSLVEKKEEKDDSIGVE